MPFYFCVCGVFFGVYHYSNFIWEKNILFMVFSCASPTLPQWIKLLQNVKWAFAVKQPDLFLIPCDPRICCSAASYVLVCVIKAACIGCTSPPSPSLSDCLARRTRSLSVFSLCSFSLLKCRGLPLAWWGHWPFPWTCCVLAPDDSFCPWGGRPPWTRRCRCCRLGCCRWWRPGRRWPHPWSPSLGRRWAASTSDGSPRWWWSLGEEVKG